MVNVPTLTAESLIAVTQQIAQAVSSVQAVRCENADPRISDFCAFCLSQDTSNPELRKQLCAPLCSCNIRDLDRFFHDVREQM